MAENEGGGEGGGKPPMTPAQLDALITRMTVLKDATVDLKLEAEEISTIQADRLENLKKEMEQNGINLKSETAKLELQKEAIKLQREDLENMAKVLESQRAAGDLTERKFEHEKQELELQKKKLAELEGTLGIEEQLTEEGEKQAAQAAKSAKWQERRAALAEVIWSSLQKQVNTVIELGKEMNTMKVDLIKAGGGAEHLKDSFMDMGTEGTFAMQKDAILGLNDSMSSFSELSREQRTQLAEQQVLFSRLGVEAGDTGEIMEMAMREWGSSMDEAMGVQLELAGAAKQLGIPTGKMMKDFAGAMPKLAKFGKGATKEFIKLQTIAKKTGISMDTMMDAMGKFDTIDGAAEAAANLNSVLGLNVNAMDMMNMSESERMMHIKEKLSLQGKDLANMSKLEKMAAAEAMGLSVSDFNKMMQAKDKNIKLDEAQAMSQGELKSVSQELVTEEERQQKIKEAAIGHNKQLAESVGNLTKMFDNFVAGLGIFGTVVTGVLGAGFTAAMAMAKAKFVDIIKGGGKAMEEGAESAEKAGPKVKSFMTDTAKGVKKLGKAASAGWKGMLAFGASVLLMGAGVAIAAWGVSKLVLAFQGFSAGEIVAITGALIAFGAMMVGLAWMLVMAAPMIGGAAVPLLAFGAAMLMMGGAVALAAIGIATLVNEAGPGLVSLITSLAPHALLLPIMGLGFGALGLGLGAMALGAGALGIALKLISTEDLQAIANMAKGFSDFARNISSEFVMAMKAIGDFVDAVDDIGSSDVKVFASLRKEIVPLLSSPVNPGVGKEMQGLSRAAMDYAKANAKLSVDADDDAFVELVKALKGAVNTTGGGGTGGTTSSGGGGGGNTIVLQVNGREFARAVGVAIDSRHDVRMQ